MPCFNLSALVPKISEFSTNYNSSPIRLHSLVEGKLRLYIVVYSPTHTYFYYRCQQTMNVDRGEYQTATIITCPLPGCSHTWCKECQQAIVLGGPEHSCDGVSELKYLMEKKGWRRCPGESWYTNWTRSS